MRAPVSLCLLCGLLAFLPTETWAKQTHKGVHKGATVQIKPNSIWFSEAANLTHWQQLKKSGNARALSNFEGDVLSQRDAWQFTRPLSVRILRYEIPKKRVKVEMLSEGRMAGTKFWLDAEAVMR